MSYRRKARPSRYFQARTRTGWRQLCSYTSDKRLADKIEGMWEELAEQHRAWDILYRVLAAEMTPAALYDLWLESRRHIEDLRRRLNDQDLSPLVAEWHAKELKRIAQDSAEHSLAHVRWLVPAEKPLLGSIATPQWLSRKLNSYPTEKRNTLRKVHSSWTGFFRYCTKVAGVYAVSPMGAVDRPAEEKSPVRFYELDVVEQIIEWQPTAHRQCLMALAYGAAIEVSVLCGLRRKDFNPARREVRAAGTKTHTRDRVSRIADWAWPTVWAYIGELEADAALFPGLTRWGAAGWHDAAIWKGLRKPTGRVDGGTGGGAVLVKAALGLPERFTLHHARDHWAVQMLRSGTPVAVVQEQLGHSSPVETLEKYGRFRPSVGDRDRWEKARDEYEKERRSGATDTTKPEDATDVTP